MYDAICQAAAVNTFISQSQFNKKLAFNGYKFCLKKLNYDSYYNSQVFNEARNKICDNLNVLNRRQVEEIF